MMPAFPKRMVRQAVAQVATRLPLRRPRTITLTYHRVSGDVRTWDPYLVVSPSTLEQQVRALQCAGYVGVTMAQQAAQLLGDDPSEVPSFAITFDDGYRDTLELAAPVLLSLQVPFTVYVITDVVSGRLRAPWYDIVAQSVLCSAVQQRTLPVLHSHALLRLLLKDMPPMPALARLLVARMKEWPDADRQALVGELCSVAGEAIIAAAPRYLDVLAVRELHAGGAEIASHTLTHPLLPLVDEQALSRELSQSRSYLADLLGSCQGLAYPNGDSDARVQAAARAAGYRYAVAATMPRDPVPRSYRLGRRPMCELSSDGLLRAFDERVFLARVSGWLG